MCQLNGLVSYNSLWACSPNRSSQIETQLLISFASTAHWSVWPSVLHNSTVQQYNPELPHPLAESLLSQTHTLSLYCHRISRILHSALKNTHSCVLNTHLHFPGIPHNTVNNSGHSQFHRTQSSQDSSTDF